MDEYCIFIDESGTASLSNVPTSPYYTICGLVINSNQRKKLLLDLQQFKLKHFKTKNFIIHGVELKRYLKLHPAKAVVIINDLKTILSNNHYFLLFSTLNKKEAIKAGWDKNTNIYKRLYRSLIENLIKFLITKKAHGTIIAEASTLVQDINLYQTLFHFLSSGIAKSSITPIQIKEHLTSLTFVTKNNNDPEEQLADLFSASGIIYSRMSEKPTYLDQVSQLDKMLYPIMLSKLFKPIGFKLTNLSKNELIQPINLYP